MKHMFLSVLEKSREAQNIVEQVNWPWCHAEQREGFFGAETLGMEGDHEPPEDWGEACSRWMEQQVERP